MSFADIRAKRQAKEEKSLVKSSSSGSKINSVPQSVDDPPEPLFEALPPSTDLRTNPESGRGIYAKERLKRGN
jgi:hypothetical protein